MKIQKKEATALTMAKGNKTYKKLYRKPVLLSILKIKIGQLLLSENPNWQWFETMLRNYINFKLNSEQRDIVC
jgi:hypothetical protein